MVLMMVCLRRKQRWCSAEGLVPVRCRLERGCKSHLQQKHTGCIGDGILGRIMKTTIVQQPRVDEMCRRTVMLATLTFRNTK